MLCYLLLLTGMRPRIRTHYRAHKLSLWLELIPQLSRIVSFQIDKGFSGLDEGRSTGIPTTPAHTSTEMYNGGVRGSSWKYVTTEASRYVTGSGGRETVLTHRPNATKTSSEDNANSTYLQILHTTIAVGTALLIINVVVFTATLYQKRSRRRYSTIGRESGNIKGGSSGDGGGGVGAGEDKSYNEYTVEHQVSPGTKHAYLKKARLYKERFDDENIPSVEKTLQNGGIVALDRSLKRGRGGGGEEQHKMSSIRPPSSNSPMNAKKVDSKKLQEIHV